MATFKLRENGFIYMVHWLDSRTALRLSTKMKIDPDGWNESKGRPKDPMATYNGHSIVNEILDYEKALTKALINNQDGSVSDLKQAILDEVNPEKVKKPKEITLNSYLTSYVEALKLKKQTNAKHYNTLLNHLNSYNSKPLPFSAIDMKFSKDFQQYLSDCGLSVNTISNMFKLLKSTMQAAFMDGVHTNEAYRYFKQKTEKSDTVYLSEQELERIYKLKLSGHLDKARDYFIIGSYTGLRYEDWDRVCNDVVKEDVMYIRSTKTDEQSIIPVHPYVRSILDKYDGTLPPKPSNQKLNEYIKIVAARAGVEELIETRITKGGVKEISHTPKSELVTTHTARRSLATNLILRGVSPFVVMKVTGHRSMSSFERYVRLEELQASIELKELEFFK